LSEVTSFIKQNQEQLLGFDSQELDSDTQSRQIQIDRKKQQRTLEFRFPSWFIRRKSTIPHAIGVILYNMEYPVSSNDITKIITKEWKPVSLRNISKYLTSKGGQPYSYIRKDSVTKGFINDLY
jgi:hypothetical protein